MRRLPFGDHDDVVEAARVVDEVVVGGGVVLLPTETFYGLGVDIRNAAAVDRVFAMKRRPRDIALPVLCGDWVQLEGLVEVPSEYRVRLSRTWPGALTAVLQCPVDLPVGSRGTLAVRIPGHAMLRAVLYRVGPLTGTSANRHGDAPCTDPEASIASLASPPDLVLDGGSTAGGAASTVVDLTGDRPRVVRSGAVDWDDPYPWGEPS